MKKILALDGGGIRGIIPGQILVVLESKLKLRSGNPDARIADYFDFFAGTSTGGILTCIHLCPDLTNPGKARFSAQEAVDLYIEHGGKIFNIGLYEKFIAVGGMLNEKYNAAPLEKCLHDYFGDLQLSQLLKPSIITSYDIENRNAHFFAQHDFIKKGAGGDFYVRDVCRATSAAPTYFETALVKSLSNVSYPLVDGGVFANNPALCAYSEVRNSAGLPTASDMFIVSIGTGSENKSYSYKKVKDYGALGWIEPLIDIMMSGASETTHYHLTKMFAAQNNSANYIRIQPSSIRNAAYAMDNATPENIQALIEVGTVTAQDCEELDRIVDVLITDKDSVTF
ncbi:MAG: patatin [Chitinophagaceae bacterium]|nr:MAG: patatin [Chitinophagaceae bacterium]